MKRELLGRRTRAHGVHVAESPSISLLREDASGSKKKKKKKKAADGALLHAVRSARNP
jgi:hypothetical protein